MLAFATYFQLPHQGMKTLELLSRYVLIWMNQRQDTDYFSGSAIFLKHQQSRHVLVSKHVACPWLFPHYYPKEQDWMSQIDEIFVTHRLELRQVLYVCSVKFRTQMTCFQDKTGHLLWERPLSSLASLHNSRYAVSLPHG